LERRKADPSFVCVGLFFFAEVVEAKGGAGSATLSMAYGSFPSPSPFHFPSLSHYLFSASSLFLHFVFLAAGAKFASLVIRASKGEKGLISPSYVSLSAEPEGGKAVVKELGGKELEFFSVRVELGVSRRCSTYPFSTTSTRGEWEGKRRKKTRSF